MTGSTSTLAWSAPALDYHALAPEIVLAAGICLVLLVDLFVEERQRWITSTLSGFVLLGAFLPIVTLGVIGDDVRSMFDGRYVVDEYSLVLKALFLLTGYVVVLMSSSEIEEGGYRAGRPLGDRARSRGPRVRARASSAPSSPTNPVAPLIRMRRRASAGGNISSCSRQNAT